MLGCYDLFRVLCGDGCVVLSAGQSYVWRPAVCGRDLCSVEHRGREGNNIEERKVKTCDRELRIILKEESKVNGAST